MFSTLQIALKYLQYYRKASNGKGHGIHSPFIFSFIRDVLNDNAHYTEYDEIESLRGELLRDRTELEIADLGAGPARGGSTTRTIASVARNAAKPKKYAQLLFRIARYYKCRNMIELGSSLGLSSLHLAKSHAGAKLVTMEGSAAIAARAAENFRKMGALNIELVEGNFDETLESVVNRMDRIDLCFIDGNHRLVPTMRYFNSCLTRAGNDSIFILDDIHWSLEMEQAWQQVKNSEAVTCTVDLFAVGIVFFRSEFKQKQHFLIRF